MEGKASDKQMKQTDSDCGCGKSGKNTQGKSIGYIKKADGRIVKRNGEPKRIPYIKAVKHRNLCFDSLYW